MFKWRFFAQANLYKIFLNSAWNLRAKLYNIFFKARQEI